MSFISESKHTARRRHRHPCFACELPVDRGDAYRRVVGLDDSGNIYSYCEHEWCARCYKAMRGAWSELMRGDQIDPGHLAENRDDHGLTTEEWRAEFWRRVTDLAGGTDEDAATYRAMLGYPGG